MTLKVFLEDGGANANREEVSVDGDFEVEVVNRGDPSHVTVAVEGDAANAVAVSDDAFFVGDRESFDVNVGVVEEEMTGYLVVSAGFEDEGSRTTLKLQPSDRSVLESDPAYDRSDVKDDEGEPRVDLFVTAVVGSAVVAVFLFALLFGQWSIALLVSVIAAFGVAIMWLFKNYEAINSRSTGPEDDSDI